MIVKAWGLVSMLVLAASACSSGAHQPAAEAAAEVDAADASVDADEAPAEAAALAHAFDGRRGYVVTATFDPPLRGAPLPQSHVFTLVLDGDAGLAVASAPEGATQGLFTTTDGVTFHAGRFAFSFQTACMSDLTYDDLTVTLTADGHLMGSATGMAKFAVAGVADSGRVGARLVGVPDTQAPVMAFDVNVDPTDPFLPITLVSSEVVPFETKVTLTSDGGDALQLVPSRASGALGVTKTFFTPPRMLRYGETYAIAIDQLVDLVGNQDKVGLRFTTDAKPPLVPDDGFESATGATLGGARVISGAAQPIITGDKSLYVPPSDTGSDGASFSPLALRLKVDAGDTFVRFSYRTVDLTDDDYHRSSFGLGAAGKPITRAAIAQSPMAKTTFRPPDGTPVHLGPVSTLELPIPAGADEVYLDLVTTHLHACTMPIMSTTPAQGIIIDDLRAE